MVLTIGSKKCISTFNLLHVRPGVLVYLNEWHMAEQSQQHVLSQ